jgi:hypothetical protein
MFRCKKNVKNLLSDKMENAHVRDHYQKDLYKEKRDTRILKIMGFPQ